MTAVIQTERLTKSYGEHRGIIELDLEVAEGEIFGFLGPNGAGKTTTMRVLLDLIRPTSGRAEVFGIETTVDPVAIHRRIGYLPGEFDLYDRLTGAQTIAYFANLRGGVDKAYVAQLVERLDLDPSRRFKEYSKGNKQKVGLIVALQHRPDLLILDEPTSGLDPLVQQTFFGLVREARDEGRTIFLSSHIIDEVDRTCDRVAIIREGRLVQVDSVEAIRELAFHHVELTFAGAGRAGRLRWPARRQRRRGRGPRRHDAGQRADRRRSSPPPPSTASSTSSAASRTSRTSSSPSTAGTRSRSTARVRDRRGARPGPARAVVAARRPRHDLRQDRPRQPAGGAPLRRRGLAVHVRHRGAVRVRAGVLDDRAPPGVHRRIDVAADRSSAACSASRSTSSSMGGFLSWRVGNFLPAMLGLWPVIALSGTLAGEAAKGSLDLLVVDAAGSPDDRAPEAGRPRDRGHRRDAHPGRRRSGLLGRRSDISPATTSRSRRRSARSCCTA